MAIDMEQFKATYIEESLEGLDIMESNLLELKPGSQDMDAINTIFRAAHSIKGGGATFGFTEISQFTHVVETLLDQIRNKERDITRDAIELFLESVDCLREMMDSSGHNESTVNERANQLKQRLDAMLASQGPGGGDAVQQAASSSDSANGNWKIKFKPNYDMLRTGNDVVRMMRELDSLAQLEVKVNTSELPGYDAMDPEACYLSWEISLSGEVKEEDIREVFAWVEDECELSITRQAEDKTGRSKPDSAAESNVAISKPATKSGDKSQLAIVEQKPAPEKAGVEKSVSGAKAGADRKSSSETSSIRVAIEKVDDLINMVGELVITQSMLSQLGNTELTEMNQQRLEKMREGLAQLERNTRELQESVMRIRMLPISFTFNRFPRLVHDMCRKLGKQIVLKVTGENTELDKTVLEKIGDPLVHIVRNSCDHGIESPEVRKQAGKSETGTVHLDAYHQGGNIVIQISDDGAGLKREKIINKAVKNGLIEEGAILSDDQVYDLLFQPGFSTAEVITDVSGRGVGMDVVKKNIQALGGRVEVSSVEGQGSTFTIRLPLTLAILDGQLVRVGKECYIMPLVSIIESMQLKKGMVRRLAGKAEVYRLRNEYVPVIRLYETFGIKSDSTELTEGLVVVVEAGDGKKAGLFVDDLLSQQQVVIKSLETNFKSVNGISGATILGDGTVALIVDIASLIRLAHGKLGVGTLDQLNKQASEAA